MAKRYRHLVYDENQRFIYPTSYWGFHYLFGSEQNKDILIGFLNKILPNLQIRNLKYLPKDEGYIHPRMASRFNVYCEFQNGSHALINMQNFVHCSASFVPQIYLSEAILKNSEISEKYGHIMGNTISVSFYGDPLFKDVKKTPTMLTLCDIGKDGSNVIIDDIMQIYIEFKKFNGNLDDPLLERIFHAGDLTKMDTETKNSYINSMSLDMRCEETYINGYEYAMSLLNDRI